MRSSATSIYTTRDPAKLWTKICSNEVVSRKDVPVGLNNGDALTSTIPSLRSTIKMYTVSPKKRPPFYFSNNSVKNEPILMIRWCVKS